MDGFTEHDQTREQLDDASIKDPTERYENRVTLADPGQGQSLK